MMWDKYQLQSDLRNGIYTIVFEKLNGEIREMRCTLQSEYLPQLLTEAADEVVPRAENPDVIAVWDLDKDAWRSMRLANIQRVSRE